MPSWPISKPHMEEHLVRPHTVLLGSKDGCTEVPHWRGADPSTPAAKASVAAEDSAVL